MRGLACVWLAEFSLTMAFTFVLAVCMRAIQIVVHTHGQTSKPHKRNDSSITRTSDVCLISGMGPRFTEHFKYIQPKA